ncbi:hypothetical protein D0Y65_001343, partial [Glycine soja]
GPSNCLAAIRFSAAFHVSKASQVWQPILFSDGLKEFRRTHGIDDSVIMRFFVADKNTSFEVDVIGPIHWQGRPRSVLATRRHIFTADVTEHMMQQSFPLICCSQCRSKDFDFDVLMMPYDHDVLMPYEHALLKLMARIADKIKTIDGSKETLKLVVRIIELWFVGTSGRSKQAEVVFVDSDGDQIHVVCKQDQLKTWKMDLKEGCTYMMHNFRVSKNDGQFRVCDHPYKLTFIGVTVVRQCELDGLPFKNYRFADFSNVIAGLLQSDLLVDIIGVVDEVVFRHISPISKRVVFKLMNLRLSELGIEIRSVLTRRSQCSSQALGSAQLSSRETFISKSEAKTISEINNLCECHKKTDVNTEPFVCPCGKHNDRAMLRYRVEVMVNYKDENTKFLLWDRECIGLIGQLADEVNTLKVEDGDLDLNASPKALDKLLGHLLTFKVKIQPRYKNSALLKCSTDLTLINDVLDMLPDAETCSKIKVTTPFDSNDPVHDESQSISITADHDPLIGLPLTPTKRHPFHECDDEARSSQISPAQLSSNKLAKHNQIE